MSARRRLAAVLSVASTRDRIGLAALLLTALTLPASVALYAAGPATATAAAVNAATALVSLAVAAVIATAQTRRA